MELWIRSQNKLSLTKVNSVIIDYNDQKSIVANYIELNGNEDYTPLGEYETEERALEVLDDIQNILKPKTFITNNNVDPEQMKILSEYFGCSTPVISTNDVKIEQLGVIVYEMPKE